MNATI